MKKVLFLLVFFAFSISALAQTASRKRTSPAKPSSAASSNRKNAPAPRPVPTPVDPAAEKVRFDQAIAAATAAEKVSALQKFLVDYPSAAEKTRAYESLTGARAALADEKLEAGETKAAVALFKLALGEAPKPYSDRFFAEVIARIPANLFWRGLRGEAFESVSAIEQSIGSNINQLLVLANFYISIENGDEAKRLSDAALKLNDQSAGAYLISGHASRLNFSLENAAIAYAKALEIEPESLVAKRSLADMKRALGNSKDSAEIYREIFTANNADQQARAGLILSLFDAGKRAEAETELAKAVEEKTASVVLLAGASYWYASQKEAVKAAEYGQKAVDAEPRYIWSHISLAHALTALGKPLDAERVLTNARKYGNFPTLEYEIASARMNSGFYREAALELTKSFAVTDGGVETKLGGRVTRRERNFADLVSYERRASIFQPANIYSPENGERLKALLDFSQKLEASVADENGLIAAADAFIKGDDRMKLHRQLFVANALLQKRIALPTVLELTKSALGNTDAALETPNAAAAVMANELYESRAIAFSRDDYLLVPDVPKQTLSAILRGRIEEIAGWTLYNQNNYTDAVVRLRRAISVYPEKSAWMRSGMWRLGAALEADGKEAEALNSYIQSYKTDKPDVVKYVVVENLYRKVNGTLEGFEAQIGPNPLPPTAAAVPEPAVETAVAAPAVVVEKVEAVQPAAVPAAEASATETAVTESEKSEPKTPDSVTELPKEIITADPPTPEPAADPAKIEPAAIEVITDLPKINPIPDPAPAETVSDPPASEPASNDSPVLNNPPQAPPDIKPDIKPDDPPIDNPIAKPAAADIQNEPPDEKIQLPITAATPTAYAVITTDLPVPVAPRPKSPTKTSKPAERSIISKTANAPLFEPIIITVPDNTAAKKPDTKESADARTQVVTSSEVRSVVPPTCRVSVSDESVSVINDGGSVGVLVTLDAGNDAQINAVSSSPENVEVKADPGTSSAAERHFYIIKSVSAALGLYEVTFNAVCGKASVSVKVR